MDAIASWMRLKPRQLRNALWLGGVLLAITSSYTLVKTSRDALFLSELPAQWLPFVYVVVGAFTLILSWVFGRLTQRLSPLQSLMWTAMGSGLALVAFAFAFTERLWIPIVFYLWVNAYGLILVSQFWAYTNSVSDPQEAKRIFGIIGGGGILGGLLGGGIAAWIGPRVPLAWLNVLGAAFLLVVAPALVFAVRKGPMRRAEEPVEQEDEQQASLARAPYVRWLGLAVLCSVIVTGLLDYQLKVVIQQHYDTAARLAGFFGWFHVTVGLAALLFQLLGTRWLLQRFGAGWTSAVLPAGLAAGAVSMLFTPGFATVLATRLWDQVLRFSINKSAVELFYFPLEQGLRRRAKALIEAGIERFGDALAGLTILAVGLVAGTAPNALAAVVSALVLVWLVAWWHLRSGYVRELGRNLRRLKLDPEHDSISLRELSVLKELARLLESPYERLVLQAIDMLEAAGALRLIETRLGPLLEHSSAQVRARALGLAVERPEEENRERIAGLIRDPDPKVRLQALRAFCALGEERSLERLDEFLDAPDPEVRGTALACLVEFTPETDLSKVRVVLERRLREDSPDRVLAADVLGARLWPNELMVLLGPLLADPDLEVRRAALRSAGRAGARDRVPQLVLALGERETQPAARVGLVAFGEGVTGALGDWLSDLRAPIEVRRTIPRVLGDIPTRASIEALYRCRDRSDGLVFYRILKASNRIRVTDPRLAFPAAMVSEDLEYDVRNYLLAEVHMRSQDHGKEEDPAERFLSLVLLERMDQAFDRIFRRLGLIHPPAAMFSAYLALLTADARMRGSAAEYVESVISTEHRALVMPLLPEARPEARRELASRLGIEDMAPRQSLEALLEDDDPWLRTCALYVAGRRREHTLRERIAANLEALDARVRETAAWAMMALEAR
jgi:AAA family ATP:ADP antiporter